MLIVTQGFTWTDFLLTTFGCAVGIFMLSAAFAGFMTTTLVPWQRILLGIASLPTIAPGLPSTLSGIVLALPVLVPQLLGRWRRRQSDPIR
jgi:TRAP-type uncharacterized transport system fused permease subunit